MARGRQKLASGVPFLDHAGSDCRHGMFDLEVEARAAIPISMTTDGGDDVGIASARRSPRPSATEGIMRYGHSYVPLDECLSRVVIDFRPSAWNSTYRSPALAVLGDSRPDPHRVLPAASSIMPR
ncbi:hypothetical protein ACU4GD_43705 [Cupriavidus basilensis]